LKKRIPADQRQFLSRDNIFIIPSRLGFAFLFLVLVLFLFGTNYQNNIIILVSYLMVSIFMTSMLTSFFNFSGLRFYMPKNSAAFAQQVISIPLELTTNKDRFDLHFSFEPVFNRIVGNKTIGIADRKNLHLKKLSCENELATVVNLPYQPIKRGIVDISRLKVSSEYAFGLFTIWTKLDFGHQCTVYPAPKNCSKYYNHLVTTGSEDITDQQMFVIETNAKKGVDEFFELKNYRIGEPISQIAWKQLARGQGHFSKHYKAHQNDDLWLVLNAMPARNIEDKLQLLCWLVLTASQSGRKFGVDLGDMKILPNSGNSHKTNCLKLLANYPNIKVELDE